MNMNHRIIFVNDLAGFMEEVKPGRVWLNLTEQLSFSGTYNLPHKEILLILQGTSQYAEIVCLMDTWQIRVLPTTEGKRAYIPWDDRDASIYDATQEARRLVEKYLHDLGYHVRNGQYGIPKDIKLIRGHFECIRWTKDANGHYTVALVQEEEDGNEQQ